VGIHSFAGAKLSLMELITLKEPARYHMTIAAFLMTAALVVLVNLLAALENTLLVQLAVLLLGYAEGYWVLWLVALALQAFVLADPTWFATSRLSTN
jgi:hypothetical protein